MTTRNLTLIITGQWQTVSKLKPYLQQVSVEEEVQVLLSVKTSDLVVYHENGKSVIGLRE